MENTCEDSVQSDSQREAVFETPASESDSGESLFLTQSVTPASRTVKRCRSSKTQACPLSQVSKDEQDGESDTNARHGDAGSSDSETGFADLLRKWRSLEKGHGRIGRPPHRAYRRVNTKKMVFPFLKQSGSGPLSDRQNKTIVSSEVGGFFKCVLKLSKGKKERRRELSPSLLDSEWDNLEENGEDDEEDIRKVKTHCFIPSAHKRNRQTWLTSLKWKTINTPTEESPLQRKSTKKSNKCQKEMQDKCSQTRRHAKEQTETQDGLDVHNESSSINKEESQSRGRIKKSRKSPARTSLSPLSSPSCPSPDKSPFARSLFLDQEEEHSENQPQVLVTCSQSQFLDGHQAQELNQACENWMEPIEEMAVEETQWPSSAEQDEDETQILEDNPMDRDRGEDAVCSENISLPEHQEQDEDSHKGVHLEPVENEGSGSVGGGFVSSQDLFLTPNTQASPLKETSVENEKEEVLESCVLPDDDIDSVIKKKKSCSLILTDVESDDVTHSKSQRTHLDEINFSSTAGDICQKRNEKDDGVGHVHPLLPLEDYTSGSRENGFSSSSKDILMVGHKEKADPPLFLHGGIKFLKRKKAKKIEPPEISDNHAQIQADPGQDEGPGMVKQKKRKKVQNEGLLEEPVDTLPEMSISADLSLPVQDCSVVCASVSVIKPQEKRKEDKKDRLLEQPVDTLQEITVATDSGVSFSEYSMVSASLGESKPKIKRKKDKHSQPVPQEDEWIDEEEAIPIPCQRSASLVSIVDETEKLAKTDLFIPSMSQEVSQLDNNTQVNKDLVQADGFDPQRKNKKEAKKRDSSPKMVSDGGVTSYCSEESHSNHGTKTIKKKKQKFIKDVREGQVGQSATASKNLAESLDKVLEIPAGIEIQPMNSVDLKPDDSITPRKKKKRKRQKVVREENVEASFVATTGQVETPNIFEDFEQQAPEMDLLRKVKKRKKKKDRTETRQDEEASQNLVQADGFEPIRKKKKEAKKRDSSPMMRESDEGVASYCSEESHSNHGTKTIKKKKRKFIEDVEEGQVGQSATASKNLGESLDKVHEIPAGIEIQPMNNVDLKPDDSITTKKKKKRKRQEVVREENVEVEASLVETTGQVETPDTFEDFEQQAPEMDLLRKVKKRKKKKDKTETHQDEEASKNKSMFLGHELEDMTTSETPSNRCETGGIGEEEGIAGSEPVKKKKQKKKKKKELENDRSLSVSHVLVHTHDTDQATVVEGPSNSGQELGNEDPSSCMEMQLTNDANEKKKPEEINGDGSECSQQVLQSEDTIQPKVKKKKKKKKKRPEEMDLEVYTEIAEHERGSPSEPIIEEEEKKKKKKKKKKKNRKDTGDRGENESFGCISEEPRDV